MDWTTASAAGLNDMNLEDYEDYRKIIHDWGQYAPVEILQPHDKPTFNFRIDKVRRLVEFQMKHGLARKILRHGLLGFETPRPKALTDDWLALRFLYSGHLVSWAERKYMAFDPAFTY